MTKKVTLPRDVAEAIDDVMQFYSIGEIIETIVQDRGNIAYGTRMNALIKYYRKESYYLDLLMSALVNGYEIEQSPEETLRQYYGDAKSNSRWAIDGSGNQIRYKERVEAVETTLRILGIQIEGINAGGDS